MNYIVNIKREAFAAMVMNGLEAFLMPMKNKETAEKPEEAKGQEIFGYIFGEREKININNVAYTVEFINFEITAGTSAEEVEYETDSIEIKKAISKIVMPKMKFLGNFHTHPFLNLERMTLTKVFKSEMWEPSDTDIEEEGAMDFQLDMIMTVTNAKKALIKGTCSLQSNCLQFDLENMRFCLAAYARRRDNELSYPPYVDPAEVKLNRPEGLWRTPKKLHISDSTREEYFKI